MIIAWGLFLISIFAVFVFIAAPNKSDTDGKNITIYGLLALFSAQYIWG